MKQLLVFLSFIFSLHLSQAQDTWDFEAHNIPVKEALQKLSLQSNIPIAFSSRIFDKTHRLSLSLRRASFENILEQILEGTGVEYTQQGKGVILRKQKVSFHTLSGYISDAASGERLIQAAVFVPALGKGILTNEYGYYSLELPAGIHEVKIVYTGYSPVIKYLDLKQSEALTIGMESNLDLEEVLITRDKNALPNSGFPKMGVHSINTLSLSLAPNLLGESDLVQQVRMLPGVQSAADGFGGIHVRGGDHSQNLVMLDGVPVYNPSHLMGFFSIFNSQAIRSAQLHAGGFSSRYGGRLSSVLDVHTREGNEKEWNTELSMGMLSGNLLVEGPISRDRGAILISGRNVFLPNLLRGPIDKIFPIPELSGLTDGRDIQFGFYDVNAKVHYSFSPEDRVYLSFYKGADRLSREFLDTSDPEFIFGQDRRLNWGNQIFSARWNHIFNAKLFSNLTLAHSLYNFQRVDFYSFTDPVFNDSQEFFFQDANSNIKDLAANLDFFYYPGEKHRLQFGMGVNRHLIDPDFITYTDENEEFDEEEEIDLDELLALESELIFQALEAHMYIDHTYQHNSQLSFNLGGRLSHFQSEGESFFNLEPRIQVNYLVHKNVQIQIGSSRMIQYLHQIGADLGMPSDIWLPSGGGLEPQKAWQQEMAIQFQKANWRFRLSAYTKQMEDLPFLNAPDSTLNLTENFSEDLFQGSGKSKGIELSVEKTSGKTRGFLSYTLSKTERTFPLENLGRTYPYQYDNRHRLGLNLLHRIKANLSISMSWNYASGLPQLSIAGQDGLSYLEVVDQNDPGRKNSKRNTSFHHLDLGLNYSIQRRKLKHDFKVGVYNAYNRSNTSFHRLTLDETFSISPQRISLMPILPSFRYTLSF